jgi:transmembrane sensor
MSMMKVLEKKYREDILTTKDLSELRNKINSMEDTELEKVMFDSWMNDETYTVSVEDKDLNRIKDRVHKSISSPTKGRNIFFRYLQVAAAVLLIAFIGTTYYLYKENKMLTSQNMLVTTGKGEHANITLPDGTQVSLNSESKITYIPKLFSSFTRTIRFDGDGYFQVSKNKSRPFIIESKGLCVKVLGTKFNLHARENDSRAELWLKEGKVTFSSLLSGETVELKPNEKVVMDRQSGRLSVTKENTSETSYNCKEMKFNKEPLSYVLQIIGNSYNVKFAVDSRINLNDMFTGTLPTTNLQEVLDALECSYHIKAINNGGKIYLRH